MPDRPPPKKSRRSGMLPPVGARTPGLDDLGDDADSRAGDRNDARAETWEGSWDEPNYLVRRALAIGAGIAAIGVAVFLAFTLIGGGDDDSTGSVVDTDWNSVVVLTADEIRVIDPSNGDIIDTFDGEGNLLDAQSATAGKVLVTMSDAGRIVQTDLTDGTTTRGRAGLDETLRMSTDNPTIGIAGADGGGDVTLIDTELRRTLSVESIAGLDDPLVFATDVLVSPDGSHAAMADARSFQSVVVNITEETAELLAGQVVALGDDRVVTAQRAGASTELEFYDLLGERLGSVDVVTPAASMLTSDGSMLLVDSTGTIRRADADGDVSDLGSLTRPDDPDATFEVTGGVSADGGERLLVVTTRGVHLLDAQGEQLGLAQGEITSPVSRISQCAMIGSARSTGTSVLLDLDDGSVITELGGGIPSTTSVDGCTVALLGPSGPQLVVADEVRDIDANAIIEIAPDGSSYVVLDGRDSELVSVEGDGNVEVADEATVIRFANL